MQEYSEPRNRRATFRAQIVAPSPLIKFVGDPFGSNERFAKGETGPDRPISITAG